MELLIVIVIIGILWAALIPRISWTIEKTRRTKAQMELQQIIAAINIMERDTGAKFGGMPVGTCTANDEFPLDPANCSGWLICDTTTRPSGGTHTFQNRIWPYVREDLLTDGRGNYYVYDYDIHCGGEGDVPYYKCDMEEDDSPRIVAGIYSMWPDGIPNSYEDDEILITCVPD